MTHPSYSSLPFSIEHRVDALELLLQQLLLSLDAEPQFCASDFENWMRLVGDRMATHRTASPPVLAALARLQGLLSS